MIVLMMLIAVSMAITVIAQPLRNRFGPTTTTAATTQTTATAARPEEKKKAPGPAGRSATRQVTATFRPDSPNRVEIAAGDQLTLFVRVKSPQQVGVPALGLVSFADPYAPARFDIFPRETGRLEVRSSAGRDLGSIVVVKQRGSQSR